VGFGLDLKLLASSASGGQASSSEAIMAWTGKLNPSEALAVSRSFNKRGLPVELSWTPSRKSSIALARRRRYRWWTDLSGETVYDLMENTSFGKGQWLEARKTC
jgi:hypothetical protein